MNIEQKGKYTVKLENLLYFIPILLLAVLGLVHASRTSFIPVNFIFELIFLTSFLFVMKRVHKEVILYLIVACIYVYYSFLTAYIYGGVDLRDFLQAYKAFVYIPMLAFFVGKSIIDPLFIQRLFRLLLIVFFFKYSYSVFLGIDARPIVFTENNFELIFLLLVYFLHHIGNREKLNLYEFIPLVYIFIMSGSRSALLALLFLYFMTIFKRLDRKTLISIVFFIILFLITLYIFQQRMVNMNWENIDRVRFALQFLNDTKSWEWWRFFIGAAPLTPMSEETCSNLRYYSSLFSYKDDGSCYSVILHSYILRVIYDHGLLGLSFLIMFVFSSLGVMNFSRKQRFTVIGIILISSLSVSAFNSIYVVMGLVFYFLHTKNQFSKLDKGMTRVKTIDR